MMLYRNRVFVASAEVYDIVEGGGFNTVDGQIPRVFVPSGTRVCNEPVTRMGVLGVFSMQKAVHHWFTADRTIDINEGSWLQALPPMPLAKLDMPTFIILETANHIYAVILTRTEQKWAEVTGGKLELGATAEDDGVMYVMQLIQITDDAVLFTDSVIAVGNQYSSFQLQPAMNVIPVTVTGQMILHLYDALGKVDLHKWEVTDTDQLGINEIPIPSGTQAVIAGYAQFLRMPIPADKKLYN